MRIAAALANPWSTGRDMRYEIRPSRKSPTRIRATPTTRARRLASAMNLGDPGVARVEMAPRVRREVSAPGPVWRYGDEAKNAAAMGGRAAAYRP
jgi:hypothetical protein